MTDPDFRIIRPQDQKLWPGFAALLALLCVIFYFWFGLLLFLMGCRSTVDEADSLARETSLQESVADEVLRLHIIADSNSEADQQVKLLVKEAVLTYLKPCLADVTTKEQAIEVISEQLDELARTASQVLADQGFSYSASAELTRSYFPIKVYGDLRLPAGEYDALKIRLGSASGKNWWCLVFPQLCFVDVTYGVLPEESRDELRALLTEEKFRLLFPDDNGNTSESVLPRLAEAGLPFDCREFLPESGADTVLLILPEAAYLSARLSPAEEAQEAAPVVRFWILEQLKKLFQ
ncbi:MAG: stage II sporulation protein R [Lachnospiraceae bacterium]|nr:stage II sporulation protein R [Lachnospiraceae bacterium]